MNQIPLCRCSLRAVRARDDPHLQGGVVPPAAGLRHHDRAVPRHAGAEGDGAGRAEPLVVAVAHDVRAAGCARACTARSRRAGRSSSCPTTSCASASSTRRCRRPTSSASRCPTRDLQVERGARALRFRRRSTGASSTTCSRATARATASACATRVKAWDDGAWVREAAVAHAEKRRRAEAQVAATNAPVQPARGRRSR